MNTFMDENFLLKTETARLLYHKYAAAMPIIDYHNHLIPAQIAEDTRFSNLYEIWLSGDHYKWRAMRSFGIDEKYITGSASPYEKFEQYARMIPWTIGNPLYHWTHLELQRYFGIDTPLSPKSAREIWDKSERMLADKSMSARYFLKASNVRAACTTDDPADSLEHHRKIAEDKSFPVKILPTFRPDKALALEDREAYISYLTRLGQAAGVNIQSYDSLLEALDRRQDFFHSLGCRISDHALTTSIFASATPQELRRLYDNMLQGRELDSLEIEKLQTGLLSAIAAMNRRRGWTMQLHIGALRNNNSKMFASLGPDTGYDSINDGPIAKKLAAFLDGVETDGGLPKLILYVLNPSDNYTIATMIGNFQDGSIPGKIQFGSGWWFNDQRDGMESQMKALANLGLLSRFVGMLTDSRSFLSFPRHEYFRRILCNMMGEWVENGEYPMDEEVLGCMVQDICYHNARNYLQLGLES